MATTIILQRVCFLPLLMALLNMSGCYAGGDQFYTGPVVGSGATGRSTLGYRLQGWKWEKERISYKILNFPAYFSHDSVKQEIKKAFEVWANVTNLSFHEVTGWEEKADIKISFGEKLAPDLIGYTIHNAGGAFIRFNSEYKFSTDYTDINLLQVAAREIGYSLGLDNSPNEESLMHMYYKSVEPKELLSKDDIQGIQALYTAKKKTEQETKGQGNGNGENHTIVIDLE